jgi:hypothetical protein
MGNTKKLLLVMAAVAASIGFASRGYAQTSTDFAAAISPLPILLDAKPGTSVTSDLRVNNPSSHNEKLKVVVKTFTQDGPDGIVNIHDPTPADTFINWISFDKTEFDAPPGLWQTVKMKINVPKEASLGYYFVVEFTGADKTAKTNSNGTAIQGAVASFVLLNTQSAGEKRSMQVTKFTASHKFYEFLPVDFSIRLHNAGNVYAGASGNIFIMRGSKQVAVLNVNENHGLVLPASNRQFSVSWNSGFPVYKQASGSNGQPVNDKSGQPKRNLKWDFSQVSKLRFGHYTAKLALVYNDGQRDIPISGEVSFWVIPWRLLAIILVIVGLIAGLTAYVVVLRRRLKNASQPRKKKVSHED